MVRITLSTCGVLAEVAAFDAAAPASAIIFSAAGLLVAGIVWWTDARKWIDHLVGLDL